MPKSISFAETARCYNNLDLPESKQNILEDVRKYTYNDDEGFVRFDMDKASTERVSHEIQAIGKDINSISDVMKKEIGNNSEVSLRVASSGLMLYGNYCGKGNRGWNVQPKDNLDSACRDHDKCYVHGGNNTACNKKFCNNLRAVIKGSAEGTPKFRFAAAAMTIFCWGL